MFIYNAGVWVFHMCAGTCRNQKKVWDLLELEVTVSCSDGCWELNTGPPKSDITQASPEPWLQPLHYSDN